MEKDEIRQLEIRIGAIKENLEACRIMNDISGVEYYRGLLIGLEEKLITLRKIGNIGD